MRKPQLSIICSTLIFCALGFSATDPTKKFLGLGGGSLTPGVKTAKPADPEAVRVYNEILAKAQVGDAEAQQKVGVYFLLGKSPVTKDERQAEAWLLKSADQGWSPSFSDLKIIHLNRSRAGGSTQELAEAYKWTYLSRGGPASSVGEKVLSEQTKAEGEALAKQYQVAHGLTTAPDAGAVGSASSVSATRGLDDRMLKYNEVKAKADAGDAEAQYKMAGYSASPPSRSVPVDLQAELSWLLKSAKQDYLPAINRLESYYEIKSIKDHNNADLKAESLKWKIIGGKFSGSRFRKSIDSSVSESTQDEAQRRADAYFAERNIK